MKKLRFDRLTDDLSGIVLRKATDGEELVLDVDDKLLMRLDELIEARKGEGAEAGSGASPGPVKQAESAVSARQISTIPHSGEEAVAAVKNFALPESGSIVEAVSASLKAKMILLPDEIFESSWRAEARKGGGWIVKFDYLLGGQGKTAEWVVDDLKREIRPLNPIADDLELGENRPKPAASNRGRRGRRRRS